MAVRRHRIISADVHLGVVMVWVRALERVSKQVQLVGRAIAIRSVVIAISIFLGFHLLAAPAHATGVYNMPFLSADEPMWVLDDADIISRANAGQISRELSTLARETGNEVRFVTIRRLDYGETIESFTEQLFEKWFPAEDVATNQTLLVLDSVTNNSAIRTGAEVKSLMADDIAESVAQETLQVPLRQGNKYNQALLDASDRLVAVLSGNPDPGPPVVETVAKSESTFTSAEETDQGNATVIVVGFLVAATIIPMVTYYLYVR